MNLLAADVRTVPDSFRYLVPPPVGTKKVLGFVFQPRSCVCSRWMKFYLTAARRQTLCFELFSHPSVTPLMLFHSYNMLNDAVMGLFEAARPLRGCICSRCYYCCDIMFPWSTPSSFFPECGAVRKGQAVVCWMFFTQGRQSLAHS